MLDEQRAAREDVVGIRPDLVFRSWCLKGVTPSRCCSALCARDLDVAPGRMVYTAMLNERGGFESDLTITRIAADTFFILTGSAQATRDADWIGKHIAENEFAALFDVTSAYSIISVMGPKSRELLERISADDLSAQAFPSPPRAKSTSVTRARAARMSYIGGAGYEALRSTDQCLTLYDALHAAGSDLGLRDAGYYTIDALRIEAGRRAWGAELGPDETPWEAGLGYAVGSGQGRGVHRPRCAAASAGRGCTQEAAAVSFSTIRGAFPWGGEPILMDGMSVGELTSAGYSRKYGRALAMGYVRARSPARR